MYICICIYVYVYMYMYTYIYIERERDIDRLDRHVYGCIHIIIRIVSYHVMLYHICYAALAPPKACEQVGWACRWSSAMPWQSLRPEVCFL